MPHTATINYTNFYHINRDASDLFNPQVGDGATVCFFSDRNACTVIKRTKSTVFVQQDKAVLLNDADSGEEDALRVSIGGFAAHIDGTQRYQYERNENGRIYKFSRRKNGKWALSGSKNGMRLIAGRHEHYDYNF